MGYPSEDHEVIDRITRDVDHHSKSHGFQEEWELADKLEVLADELERPVGWGDYELPVEWAETMRAAAKALRVNFLGMKLALMHSELSEALERLREVGIDAVLAGDELFIEELADVNIRTMETVAIIGKQGLGKILLAKIKSNASRPFKHGKEH